MGLFEKETPSSFEIVGCVLKCKVCEHDEFWKREAQLHTSIATFFNLEWTNRSAMCLVCSKCGYIHWFLPQ